MWIDVFWLIVGVIVVFSLGQQYGAGRGAKDGYNAGYNAGLEKGREENSDH